MDHRTGRTAAVARGAVAGTIATGVMSLVLEAGWVPAAGILAPPQRDDPGRQPVLVGGHVVYGAVLAAVLRLMLRGRSRVRDAA